MVCLELDESESVVAKEFLDGKCLSQSYLKLDKDNVLVQVEVPSPQIYVPIPMESLASDPYFENILVEFMRFVRDDMKLIITKLDDLAEENNFFRDLIVGSATPASGPSGAFPFTPTQRSIESVLAAAAKQYGLQFASTTTKNVDVDVVKDSSLAKDVVEPDETASESPAT